MIYLPFAVRGQLDPDFRLKDKHKNAHTEMQFQCYAHYYSIVMRTITRHTIHVGALENYTKSSNNNNNLKFIKRLFHANMIKSA